VFMYYIIVASWGTIYSHDFLFYTLLYYYDIHLFIHFVNKLTCLGKYQQKVFIINNNNKNKNVSNKYVAQFNWQT